MFELKINNTLCTLCEQCIEECPSDSLFVFHDKLCWNFKTCYKDEYCVDSCPEEAITGGFQ